MLGILIKTIGELSLPSRVGLNSQYSYDIPIDELGFPYLPIRQILVEMGLPPLDIHIGFAHPQGYLGMIREANKIESQFPNDREFVQDLYINERFYLEDNCSVRSLKEGQLFCAPIYGRREAVDALQSFLSGIDHLGIRYKDITGQVQLSISPLENEHANILQLNDKLHYTALEYTVHLLTPTSIHAPYNDGVKTHLHIPGDGIRNALLQYCEQTELTSTLRQMTFSNAYISDGRHRLLPVPLSLSVVKLDRDELRSRLSTGKDPRRLEQDVTLYNTFTDNFECPTMRYTKPETERIVSYKGNMHDALRPGQTFSGLVYGPDQALRHLAAHIQSNPRISLGALAEEGFGEAYIDLSGIHEDNTSTATLATQFDIVCLSHTILLDATGMPSCKPQALLDEVERLLGIQGQLRITAAYTDFCNLTDLPVHRWIRHPRSHRRRQPHRHRPTPPHLHRRKPARRLRRSHAPPCPEPLLPTRREAPATQIHHGSAHILSQSVDGCLLCPIHTHTQTQEIRQSPRHPRLRRIPRQYSSRHPRAHRDTL